MFNKKCIFILFSILLGANTLAQSDFFKNFDGIPITTNLWGKEGGMFGNSE